MTFEKIKRFLDEKVFNRKSQKLLMSGEFNKEKNKLNLNEIFYYMENEKYTKDFAVTFIGIAPKILHFIVNKIILNQ